MASVEVWPFRETWYALSEMDDRVLWDRSRAESNCRAAGLDWSKAYRNYRVVKRVRGVDSVVITWRIR